jgi:hypothetical protein
MIVPSTFFAYQAINRSRYAGNIERYIADNFTSKGHTIHLQKQQSTSNSGHIGTCVFKPGFKPVEIDSFQQTMKRYDLGVTRLVIKQNVNSFRTMNGAG